MSTAKIRHRRARRARLRVDRQVHRERCNPCPHGFTARKSLYDEQGIWQQRETCLTCDRVRFRPVLPGKAVVPGWKPMTDYGSWGAWHNRSFTLGPAIGHIVGYIKP